MTWPASAICKRLHTFCTGMGLPSRVLSGKKPLFAATCLLQLRRQFVAQPCVSYLLHRNEAGFFAECCGRF